MKAKLIFFASVLAIKPITPQTIYLDWFGDDLRYDKLFQLPEGNGEEYKLLREKLKIKNITLTTSPHRGAHQSADIYYGTKYNMPRGASGPASLNAYFNTYGKDKFALFLWEPPSVIPENFDREIHKNIKTIFTWADDLVDNQHYFKFFYPQPKSVHVPTIPFSEKKFCCTVIANKGSTHCNELYSERYKTVAYFDARDLNDLFGPGWNPAYFRNYKGRVDDKFKLLAHYKFSVCYENIKDIPGYVSEKLHHCLLAGCVPIYWGASNVTDYVPAECFVDRRNFSSNEELLSFLLSMSEEEYNNYLDAAKRYLASKEQMLFSDIYFVDCCLKGFIPNYARAEFFNEHEVALLEELDAIQQKIIKKAKKDRYRTTKN